MSTRAVRMDVSAADSKEPQPVLETVPTPSRKPLPPRGPMRADRKHVTVPAQMLLGTSPKCLDRSPVAKSPTRMASVRGSSQTAPRARICGISGPPKEASGAPSPSKHGARRHSDPTFGLPQDPASHSPYPRNAKTLRFQSSRSPSPILPDSPLAGAKKVRARSQSAPRRPGDPFNLYRFVEAQSENGTFDRALREIRAGRKSSCWMWFVIPSPPHMKHNIEHGSSTNRKYAIRSDDEAKAYLNYEADGVDLRSNYFAILSAVCEHLVAGKAARSVIGSFDEPKLASSIVFFERITRAQDNELHSLLVKLASLMNLQHSS
mmetsp:Transcript_43917/g.82047  ORF Transcript_43917/g.82047 Transcript_43917/m.82047 type:complete len:320 (+) Transcript_43917:41-1000(+)